MIERTLAATPQTDPTAQPPRDVLVIEDDPVVSRLVGHLLTRRGFTVHVAADGLHAQTLLKTLPRPAVVVMDVMLPYVSGFELITEIRKTPGWDRVPVIVLTSKSQERDVLRAFDAGVNDYVVKPFRPDEFVARVRRLADS
ncbi:MAG TPA: response regulator transcription factor [Vicinamibacterales bacterium]|nr:response regulator transcription factor [Vicinamibacterales bacterium]